MTRRTWWVAGVLTGASLILCGCDNKDTSGTAGSASAGSAKSTAKSDLVKASEDYATAACACKDATCASDAAKKYAEASTKAAKTPPSEADGKAIADATQKATACTTKLATAMATAATASASAAAGGSKCEQAALAMRKAKHPEENPPDKTKVDYDAKQCVTDKWTEARMDCFIAAKTKDDINKCIK